MMHIDVEQTHNDLHKEIWTFYFSDRDVQLVLIKYFDLHRATKRHKFTTQHKYDRYDHWKRHSNLTIDEVELPAHVIRNAIEQFMNKLTVVKAKN